MKPGGLHSKGIKVRETAVGTLGPFQERLDLASPDATPAITVPASSWSDKTLIYSIPSSYSYLVYFIIVSFDAVMAANYSDFNLLRRPANGVPSDDVIVGRSSFFNARSITYPAGEEFKSGEDIYITFRNIFGTPIILNYFIHGILERV